MFDCTNRWFFGEVLSQKITRTEIYWWDWQNYRWSYWQVVWFQRQNYWINKGGFSQQRRCLFLGNDSDPKFYKPKRWRSDKCIRKSWFGNIDRKRQQEDGLNIESTEINWGSINAIIHSVPVRIRTAEKWKQEGRSCLFLFWSNGTQEYWYENSINFWGNRCFDLFLRQKTNQKIKSTL